MTGLWRAHHRVLPTPGRLSASTGKGCAWGAQCGRMKGCGEHRCKTNDHRMEDSDFENVSIARRENGHSLSINNVSFSDAFL